MSHPVFDKLWDEQPLPTKPKGDALDSLWRNPAPADMTRAVPKRKGTTLGRDLTDAAMAMNQGSTFGFADEAAAATMALVNKLFGQPGHYDELVKEVRDEYKQMEERSPVLNVAGQIAGAVESGGLAGAGTKAAVGGAERSAVKTFLANRAKAAGIGAGAGGVAGFGAGEGSPVERLPGAARGAAYGGAFGTALDLGGQAVKATGIPALIKNLVARPNTSSSTAGRVAGAAGLASHEDIALVKLLDDIRRSGLPISEYLRRAEQNPEMPLYDLGPSMNNKVGSATVKVNPAGDPLVRRARGVQATTSSGSREVTDFLNARAEQRPTEVKEALEKGLGVSRENTVKLEQSLKNQRVATDNKNYGPLHDIVVDDPEALALFDEPEFRQLHEIVRSDARLRREPEIPPLKSESAIITGAEGRAPLDVLNPQTLGTLDKMYRFAGDIAAGRIEGGAIQRSQARAMVARLRDIRNRLDELHPEYGEARAASAEGAGSIEAAQEGTNFFKTSGDQLEVDWAGLSPAEKVNFRKTALAQIEEQLASGMNPAKLLNGLNARKLKIIADSPEAYEGFEKALRAKIQGATNDAMITGNSVTPRVGQELADLTGDAGAAGVAVQAMSGNVPGLMSRLGQKVMSSRAAGLGETRADLLAPYLTASGADLTKRLLTAKELQDALQDALQRRIARQSAAAGQIGAKAGTP
jgi:hypothetical protein